MRRTFRLLPLFALLALSLPSSAKAQSFVYVGPSFVAQNVPVLPSYPIAMPSYGAPRVLTNGSYFPTYDYWAAPYPLPARLYSGYGNNDFPFYGQTYGHAYEPWTWSGLSRWPAYPPVRVTGVVGP